MADQVDPQTHGKATEPGVVEPFATRGAAYAPQCPAVGTNQTFWLVRRRKVRYQRKATYHYHHAP